MTMNRPVTQSRYEMLLPADALNIVLQHTQLLEAQTLSLDDAGGYILASDVVAHEPLPHFPAAMKDGYAVVASDGPGDYAVIGEVRAGTPPAFTVEPGTVAYITTGAPMPKGADAVVMVEDTEPLQSVQGKQGTRIKISAKSGHEVRPIGIDIDTGQTVLKAGERLTAAEVGLLATVGYENVSVYRTPVVAVFSTGDELIGIGDKLEPGKIRDSNRHMILQAVRDAGAVPMDMGRAPDDASEIEKRVIDSLASADVVITSGGVSMGDADFIKPVLERQGKIHFGRIRLKPGKPLTFATTEVDGKRSLFFGLPGNPVSSLVTFQLFVVPALRKMMGMAEPDLVRVQAYLAETLKPDAERTEYHRATLEWDGTLNGGAGGYLARSTGSQMSSRLLSMLHASALLVLPPGDDPIPAGAVVEALQLGNVQ